jgi:cold shock CspA family protein
MARAQCEHCGEEFDNEYKLFRHKKSCTADSDSEAESDATGVSSDDGAYSSRVEGSLLRYFEDEGYGFAMVADKEYTDDVFVHIANTDTDELEEGDHLEFDVVENDQGFKAEDVTVLERADERDETDRVVTDDPVRDPALRLGFGRQADDT